MVTIKQSDERLQVFFDGACHLCSREVQHYQRMSESKRIDWIDIATPDFNAASFGLDGVAVQKSIHSKRGSQVFSGVDTFLEIWKELPRYRWLSKLTQKPFVRPFMDAGYAVFARIRPFLPKRRCESSQCSL